ncbi:MAG: hypothetical protein ABJE79_00395 [Marinomonas sp.]
MKAIKLASIFAVSAVAAAVSTTTIAAEAPPAVFTGSAGVNYTLADTDDSAKAWGTEGEVNIIADTGVVYFDIDMSGDSLVLDEAYVTQGAVQFGDFDGSISTDAVAGAGVYSENGEYDDGDSATLGVRYTVADGLVVAVEGVEGAEDIGFGVSFSSGIFAASAGSVGDDTTYSVGVTTDLEGASLMASYTGGEASATDLSVAILGADFTVSEAVSISAQYNADLEGEESNIEIAAYYTAGDITYFVSNISGDYEETMIGAYASF